MSIIRKLNRDTKGLAAIEFALIASLISIAAIAGFVEVGDKVQAKFDTVNYEVSSH